ncbi:hypothetical protein [Pseudomonas putida]
MLKPILFISLFPASLPTHALDTQLTPPGHLLRLGSELATNAGASQWQQLWQRVRSAGYLQAQPGQDHFSVGQAQLPELVRSTLAQADQVSAVDTTRALYRRDFPGRTVGLRDGQPLSAVCLIVEWRSLPQSAVSAPHAYLQNAGLVISYPCN